MPTHDWKPFLQLFSRDMLADDAIRASLSPDAIASGWLGYPGATEAQIAEAEARLGTTLPPSYREFLAVTNGWLNMSAFIYRLWPAEQIDWFKTRNQRAIDAWLLGESYYAPAGASGPSVPDSEYFVYGESQDPTSLRTEYLRTALEISDWGDSAILLLNPRVTFGDGEWEAWFHASWLPGANRYRSFWDLMQAEYKSFLTLNDNKA